MNLGIGQEQQPTFIARFIVATGANAGKTLILQWARFLWGWSTDLSIINESELTIYNPLINIKYRDANHIIIFSMLPLNNRFDIIVMRCNFKKLENPLRRFETMRNHSNNLRIAVPTCFMCFSPYQSAMARSC
ncbi:hypothetical protein [Xanthomonas albilineans]|uniref:hypothetical protein n=1 Tax=Xanthomonas albilineans TaxID=29447 RepID=UPI00126A69E2|nr:hypothetical protein [Xanthomonas albilineans]